MIELETERLRACRDADRAPFVTMNADPEVMRYCPSLQTRAQGDSSIDMLARDERPH